MIGIVCSVLPQCHYYLFVSATKGNPFKITGEVCVFIIMGVVMCTVIPYTDTIVTVGMAWTTGHPTENVTDMFNAIITN